MIFQEPMTALNPVLTVRFQIVETLRQHFGVSPAEAKARAVELLTLVELPDRRKPSTRTRTSCPAASVSAR
jgi:peptide/nickel transport system ATP-binding protein